MEGRRWIFLCLYWSSQICHRPFLTRVALFYPINPSLAENRKDLQEKMDDSAFAPAPSMAPVQDPKAPYSAFQGS